MSSLPVLHRLQSAAGQVGVQQIAKDLDVGHRSPVHLRQEETTWFSLGALLCSWVPPLLSDTFLRRLEHTPVVPAGPPGLSSCPTALTPASPAPARSGQFPKAPGSGPSPPWGLGLHTSGSRWIYDWEWGILGEVGGRGEHLPASPLQTSPSYTVRRT